MIHAPGSDFGEEHSAVSRIDEPVAPGCPGAMTPLPKHENNLIF
jgi:hypothetical protein